MKSLSNKLLLAAPTLLLSPNMAHAAQEQPNIILFTADDLGWISLGCYGATEDVTPNLDQFAREGMQFNHGFVNAAISAPSRRIMCTGMYGHNSGAMGFLEVDPKRNAPILMDILKDNGYTTGILGKVGHSSPTHDYAWDFSYDYGDLGRGRNPQLYAQYTEEFIKKAKKDGEPFYMMINSHDPHRPFHNPEDPNALRGNAVEPSRLFTPEEIDVPGFVPDTKEVRLELSHYFNSTRRLDDTFGEVMKVIEKLGCKENTIIVFISDNGVAIPFAKANTYYASNRTPFLVRWPAKIKPQSVNNVDFVSEVDLLATFLDVAGIDVPEKTNGKSFKPALMGKVGKHHTCSYHQIDKKIGGAPTPMRSVITSDYCYIFNAFHDGKRIYKNNNEGETMKSMEALAEADPTMQARVELYRKRVPEELYDMRKDPNGLNNLIGSAKHKKALEEMQALMREKMVANNDTLLPTFDARDDFTKKELALFAAYPELDKKNKKVQDEIRAAQLAKKKEKEERKATERRKTPRRESERSQGQPRKRN